MKENKKKKDKSEYRVYTYDIKPFVTIFNEEVFVYEIADRLDTR